MPSKERVSEVVDLIDGLMKKGVSHMNLDVTDEEATPNIKIYRSNDCGDKETPCQITNLDEE